MWFDWLHSVAILYSTIIQSVFCLFPGMFCNLPLSTSIAESARYYTIEVSSDEDGLKGAWFAATIVEPVGKDKYLIEYQALRTEDDSDFLREEIDTVHIRPCPPQTIMIDRFKKLEEVDALFNDAWWVGVVSRVNTFPKYLVFFKDSNEELEFQHSDLRPHQDWINGKLVTPSKKVPDTTQVKPIESPKDAKFSKGMLVEVSSDEDGLKGAWFAATIVEPVGKDKYLIEYQALRTEDDSDFLREEIDTVHIRPCPPQTIMIDRFKKLEEVDALFNDAWWVGVVSRVNTFPKYLVFFKDSNEELEFQHSDLRPHQDWINGKLVTPSKV
ncbi:DUF724 domain-containing protein [Salix suchowensis]|nr:DUF724 domain-containing protein [Salix suchowensis]